MLLGWQYVKEPGFHMAVPICIYTWKH